MIEHALEPLPLVAALAVGGVAGYLLLNRTGRGTAIGAGIGMIVQVSVRLLGVS